MKNATVLVIDGGGRGSALVAKYSQSKHVAKILALPGNDLMKFLTPKPVNIYPNLKTTDKEEILKIAKGEKVDLVDVAQDDAVAAGVVDLLEKEKIKVFGPTKAAGQIEWDKSWAKKFMKKYQIPTAAFQVFNSQKKAIDFINRQKESKWYVKASGLAAGKGAIFADSNKKAIKNVKQMKSFGQAGKTFLIEECLKGEEFSSFAILNGQDFSLIGHAQDHKTVFDRDKGPNTGGMGCTSPPLAVNLKIEKQIRAIFKKAAEGLVSEKRPYRGVLYLGGLIDKSGKVYVIEFNARWGDPEAQVIVPSINNDLYEIAKASAENNYKKIKIRTDKKYRIAVAAVSKGYPEDYSQAKNKEIFGLGKLLGSPEIQIFGAGVKVSGKKFLAFGGRLFYTVAHGKDVRAARQLAYDNLAQVFIEGNNLHFRTDIGFRDLERTFK